MNFADEPRILTLFDAAIATASSAVHQPGKPAYYFKASGTTTAGAGTAGCRIYGRDIDTQAWFLLLDVTLVLSTAVAQEVGAAMTVNVRYGQVYADLYDLTGTGAALTLTMAGGS